jgi:UDP:flavonoid glycosyltransferase YjiC (YdhE family)
VTVGGSGVGTSLLRRVIDAADPSMRTIVVCGPRIDTASLPTPEGVELVGYVHELSRHLAACDVAVTQGGLTTCMELAAAKRPFLYAPLERHFEQNFHVRHRLERYGAGQAIDLATADISAAIAGALREQARPADVERDGAKRAARLLAELL